MKTIFRFSIMLALLFSLMAILWTVVYAYYWHRRKSMSFEDAFEQAFEKVLQFCKKLENHQERQTKNQIQNLIPEWPFMEAYINCWLRKHGLL